MATNELIFSVRPRCDSTESTPSLWEITYEQFTPTKQDSPFGNDDENNDSPEENPIISDGEDYETIPDASPPTSIISSSSNISSLSKPWENPTKQNYLKIIMNNEINTDECKKRLKADFSKQGLKWTNEEEELCSWHFGLTLINLKFIQPKQIDIQILSLSSSIPFWITLKKNKKQHILKKNTSNKPIRYNFTSDFDVSLNYGALINLNQFYYSLQHSSKNLQTSLNNEIPRWYLFLGEQRNGDGYIEWIIENSRIRRKKQLLVTNINHSVVVDICSEGFDIYICQKCNMNEFEAIANTNDNVTHRNNKSNQNNSSRYRSTSYHTDRPTSNPRSYSKPRAPPSLRSMHSQSGQSQRINYEHYRRIGVRYGCYFSTIQFSLRIKPFHLTNTNTRYSQNQMKSILSLFIEFFLTHNIIVCYGKIQSEIGPNPYLFFQSAIPDFPSIIMKYSWQVLSSVGYRLQIQIENGNFLPNLNELTKEKYNRDELFYRVCIYLSRICSLKPFANINNELQHAVAELKQKRDESTYGLISKIDIKEENEAYIPLVTLTPTTIRIKPLKLCRTNRVLRTTEQFGKALTHFILVDIRDENGRHLQSFHFRDLRPLLLDYLKNGFTLMADHRIYKYLHHSQSQLRQRQFWFYHHNDYDEDSNERNLSFDEAYEWMGTINEQNPAKYASRMALCFSTTKATVQVPENNVILGKDIEIKVNGTTLSFTDGCGTMSKILRDQIQKSLCIQNDFSAVQFRYGGKKGVVSVDTRMKNNKDLFIRPSMIKFESKHQCFEVCKVSAPRPLYLNRQAILLLSYRQISDTSFLILQQKNYLVLIHALLRNSDAEKMILEKVPSWFLPRDIHNAHIDYIHEPFFRQLLISSCLQSIKDLLYRTRIRIPPNKGRNMIGIVDEYNVLEPDQVFIQYTIINEDLNDDYNNQTKILDKCKVVITKNPCHHPGDIRTFIAINHPKLNHLKDVVVFSQQGNRPAPHDISGSDLDGDEYLVVWHEDLVPHETDNAIPYDYDSQIPSQWHNHFGQRDAINNIVLEIAEHDYLGRLSNLHLAFADKFGVDNNKSPARDVLSTVHLAGAISQEVDSGKTGYHPLNENEIKILNDVLKNERPDFMDNPNYEQYESNHILGQLFRASKQTLHGWNRLVQYHRHLRHLQVRTRDESKEEEVEDEDKDEDEDKEEIIDNDEDITINHDQSILDSIDRSHRAYKDCAAFANKLASVYRQEIFEILNLYGLSHESDLWCRNFINGPTGELEDTAYTELEQLVIRTRTRFFNEQVSTCETNKCNDDTPIPDLCNTCRKRQISMAVACYSACYNEENGLEKASILSLPWLFSTSLLQNQVDQERSISEGLLSKAMRKALNSLLFNKCRLRLENQTIKFKTSKNSYIVEGSIDETVCVFIEVLQECIESKQHHHWPWILSSFVRNTPSFKLFSKQTEPIEEWELIVLQHEIHETDDYAGLLFSIEWTESKDKLMHDYFQNILDICFNEGRQKHDIDFLNISEDIILLLQKMAINETIIS